MIEVLTALPGAAWEAGLVAQLDDAPGVTVVRRCVDLADLLATAASGVGAAVLLSAQLRRLDRDAVARLAVAGVAAVGVVPAGDAEAERRLRALGVDVLVAVDAGPAAVTAAVARAVQQLAAGEGAVARPALAYSEPLRSLPATPADGDDEGTDAPEEPAEGPGRLVAVWGPAGAPGRTSVAVTLASEAARSGTTTLLADADVYGGVVAQCLGLLDESPGLAAAARMAGAGSLDAEGLARVAPLVDPRLRVLTGIPRAHRWPELRPAGLEQVYALARQLAGLVVVDCGFCLEQDEELSFDTAAPRRNGATLTTLELADVVVAVCSADAIGVQRFVRALADLRDLVPGAELRVVVNRVRRAPVGPDPERQLAEALERYAGLRDCVFVPEDRSAFDSALLTGRVLADMAPGSPARAPLKRLAAQLVGKAEPERRRLRRRRPA
ncbi:AAA family ATPase [Motilibacter deserti]|uniref:Chromosome partitioning protein n=1 Tax=Motilibacter deserti TaxID=2714956 RepID=A0ABX0GTJ0_9ACTN|nr:chromosome partitioning protein [Motilibacter deserti]NHC13021.1 chromosome partitioning protein [Motilibacter deserti]